MIFVLEVANFNNACVAKVWCPYVICRQCTCGQQWRAVGLVADIGEGPDGGRRGLGAQAVTQSHHEVLVHGPQARIACMATKVYRIIRLQLNLVSHRAANYPSVFTITEKGPSS